MNFHNLRAGLLAVLALLLPAAAQAQQSGSSADCSTDNHPSCLDGVSSTVTGYDALRASAARQARLLERRDDDEAPGDAAVTRWMRHALGDGSGPSFGSFGSYTHGRYDSEVAIAPYEARADTVLVGGDRSFGAGTLGVALVMENRSTDTDYNGGGEDSDGWGLQLFGVHPLDTVYSLDWTLGHSRLSTDQHRVDPADGSRLGAAFDSSRWLAGGNANASWPLGTSWLLGGRAGLLYAAEEADGYSETGGPSARSVSGKTMHLLQAGLGAELAWQRGAFEPYAVLGYRNDLSRRDGSGAGGLPAGIDGQSDGRHEGEAALGLRWYGRRASFAAEYLHGFGRSDFSSDSLSLLYRHAL